MITRKSKKKKKEKKQNMIKMGNEMRDKREKGIPKVKPYFH